MCLCCVACTFSVVIANYPLLFVGFSHIVCCIINNPIVLHYSTALALNVFCCFCAYQHSIRDN